MSPLCNTLITTGAVVELGAIQLELAKSDPTRNSETVCLSLTSEPDLLQRDVPVTAQFDQNGTAIALIYIYIHSCTGNCMKQCI